MSTVQALSAPQGLSMPTAKKIFAFASMCVGMFIALIDIQIVSASLRDMAAACRRATMKPSGYKPAT
jgi:DHA2 family multidrug resistance protein